MSSMFGGGFKATKCKTLLRLAMARIKLLRNKRDIQIKQMRKDIAQLLSSGQEPSARIRVEHIAREQNIMAAYDIIELFCELIIVRLPIIESQKVCPMDLKEAVSSLIFASPRCSDLPELLQIRSLFSSKYGKEFVAAAAELRPECGVNRRVIEKLSVRAPSGETKLKLLKEIAAEHNVDWDPTDSEAELMKQPEDLLDGHKKFFGASEAPISLQPSPPKAEQKAPTGPPAPPPAPQGPITMEPLLSSESEEETPSAEMKQFIPFVGPVPTKGAPSGRGSQASTKGSSSSVSNTRGGPPTQAKEGPMDYEKHADYDNVAAAAKAAAESADRAVAAARAAAELAKTHPSQREPASRTASKKEEESLSSEEESEEEDDTVERTRTSGMKNESTQQGHNISSSQANDSQRYEEKSDRFYRSNSNDRPEESFRRSDSEDGSFRGTTQEVESNSFSFPRTNYPEERPDKEFNPEKKSDSEQNSFWRSGDQDWRQAANFAPAKKFDSAGFFPSQGDEQESLYRRNSDIFKGSQFDDSFSSRPKDKVSNTRSSKLFSSSDSGRDLFKRSSSEEKELRSSDETPFYDTKQGFATPKFDDEEEEDPYTKPTSRLRTDSSYNRDRDFDSQKSDFDSPKLKLSSKESWQTSSFSYPAEGPGSPKVYSDDYHPEKQRSDSFQFDKQLSDSQGLARGGSDPISTKSYYRGDDSESPQYENQTESSGIPKSRRTRKTSKGLEGAGGSGGLPPTGRLSKYSSIENVESAPSPDYPSYGEPDNSALSFDDSPSVPPKTSSLFYNSRPYASTPPDRTPPSVSSAYESPETFRESSPSVNPGSQSAKSSPSPSRRDSPSAPAIHPKLPDYDDLTARFEALKGKTRR